MTLERGKPSIDRSSIPLNKGDWPHQIHNHFSKISMGSFEKVRSLNLLSNSHVFIIRHVEGNIERFAKISNRRNKIKHVN